MLPVLQVGPLAIQVPGLVLLLGLWLGLILSERYAPQRGVKPNQLDNLVLIALVAGVIGARLVYAARYPAAFAASPMSLVSINPGLLDPWGGAAVGLIAALIYGNRKHLPLLPTLDALTPLLAVMAVAQGVSHLASGNAFGAPTPLPWGMQLWGEKRHPSQIYEILLATALLMFFFPGRALFNRWKPGVYFLAFTASSAAASLFLEAFRGDSALTAIGLRSAQIYAWIILAACLLLIAWIGNQPFPESPDQPKIEPE
jgi:prolipoprotein diacylglyceryltransferase